MKNSKKSNHGITLIALVVTIIVLLILAGITIQLVLNDGGIFNQAQRAKEQTRIGELLDKFNISEGVVVAEKLGQPSLEDFITQVQDKEGYVIEADKQEEGHYEVTTEDGYVFDVSIIIGTTTNDIVIEYIGQAGNLPPAMRVKNITTNSADIEMVRVEGATNFKYEYKKHAETTYQLAAGNTSTCKLTNLTSNTIYDVKVTVTMNGQEIVVEKQIAIGKIPTGGVIKLKSITWASGKATVVVYHEETANYRIEWQKLGAANWNQGEIGIKEISIPNLNHADTILVRLNDGVSSGNDASINVIDTIVPQPATFSFTPETVKTGETMNATVTLKDNESGINSSASKWEYNKSSSKIGTDETKYTGSFAGGTNISLKATTSGSWYLHVLSVDNAGNKVETVSKEIKIIAEVSRANGKIEIAFVDMNNTPISSNNVPTPRLGEGMTPIKWSGSTLVETTSTDNEWYNYTQKRWANAKTADGSMWVWIPRYAYLIKYLAEDGKEVIGYSNSIGITDIEGKVIEGTKKQRAVEVRGTLEGKQISKYVLHPVFTSNTQMGGWGSEIEGIWVAKFEASSNGSGTLQVKPGITSWRNISVHTLFAKCSTYNVALQSHMMKNSEWGAVAYLSKSIYGKNNEIAINEDVSYLTGGGAENAYISNIAQSTTGNEYGIYDMSGGAWEYVATYIDNGSGYLKNGERLVNCTQPNLKQVYTKGINDTNQDNYIVNMKNYGDAIYETSTAGTGSTSWYQKFSQFVAKDRPFSQRGGGRANTKDAGLFSFNEAGGGTHNLIGFRPVLVVP